MESQLLTWSSQQFRLALDKRASQVAAMLRAKMSKIEGKDYNYVSTYIQLCTYNYAIHIIIIVSSV
jgi:hypothetical protein